MPEWWNPEYSGEKTTERTSLHLSPIRVIIKYYLLGEFLTVSYFNSNLENKRIFWARTWGLWWGWTSTDPGSHPLTFIDLHCIYLEIQELLFKRMNSGHHYLNSCFSTLSKSLSVIYQFVSKMVLSRKKSFRAQRSLRSTSSVSLTLSAQRWNLWCVGFKCTMKLELLKSSRFHRRLVSYAVMLVKGAL